MRKGNSFFQRSSIIVLALVASNTFASNWQCDRRSAKEEKIPFSECWYVGAGLNLSWLDPDEEVSSWNAKSSSDTGWKLYGGYQFSRNWFAEFSYQSLGDADVEDLNTNRNIDGVISYEIPALMAGYYLDLHSLSGELIPELPFDTFVKFGVSAIDSEIEPSSIPHNEETSIQLAFGVGAQWRFARNLFLRGEFESFDEDAFTLSLSLGYIFGSGPKSAPEPKPQIVKAAPVIVEPPEPKPVEPKVLVDTDQDGVPDHLDQCPNSKPNEHVDEKGCKLKTVRVEEIKLNVQFATNSSVVVPGSIIDVHNVAEFMSKHTDLVVAVEGHTDSVGKASYNKGLSQRRAESVAKLLIEEFGIDARRVIAVGYGEEMPVATNATPEGRQANRRVVAVLQKVIIN